MIEKGAKFNNTKKEKKVTTGIKYVLAHKKQMLWAV